MAGWLESVSHTIAATALVCVIAHSSGVLMRAVGCQRLRADSLGLGSLEAGVLRGACWVAACAERRQRCFRGGARKCVETHTGGRRAVRRRCAADGGGWSFLEGGLDPVCAGPFTSGSRVE